MSAQTDVNHAQILVDCGPQKLHCLKWGAGDHHAVLLHGFPDSAWAMKPLACRLARAGYTVWAPFLRGYAPTPLAHDGRYDLLALTEDIRHLLSAEAIRNCVLVGHDWGAVIAYAVSSYGSPHIDRILGLSVPPVPVFLQAALPLSRQLWRSRYMLMFQIRYLYEYAQRRRGLPVVESLWRRWSPGWDIPAPHVESVCRALAEPGRIEAALAYYRHNLPLVGRRGRHVWNLMQQPTMHPTRYMVGASDRCIHPQAFKGLSDRLTIVPDAGHFLPLEAPDAIFDAIICG